MAKWRGDVEEFRSDKDTENRQKSEMDESAIENVVAHLLNSAFLFYGAGDNEITRLLRDKSKQNRE